MKSFSQSFGAVHSESTKHSKHPVALRLFYSVIIAVVGAALLPVIPVAAEPLTPQVSSSPSAYTALNPTRVMDTRTGSGIVGAGNTLGPGASFSLVVAPNATAGVPANATAVVMNVTVTNTTAASYLTVYPTLASLPFASNLNWVAGYTVPNLVTVQPGTGGAVTFYNKFGSVDVIADISGYFAPPSGSAGGEVGAGFPQRLVDTRAGSGSQGAGSALGPAATANYQVTGMAGVPASGVAAVILNSTVTNTTAASFLTLWAQGATMNTVSNDNWVAGWTRANRAIVPVNQTNGKISVYNQFGSVDVILDVDGYFTNASASGALFTSVSPIRLADHTALGPNSSFNQSITGVAGVPTGATAAMLNSTVSETTAPSFLTVYPTGGTRPTTSDINWVAGQVNPNLGVATLGTGGMATFYNSAGNVNVTIDLEGFFGGNGGVAVAANPSTIPADGATTSTVTATVTNADGTAAIADSVLFTTSGGTSCGTLTTANPTPTNGSGAATITYKASATAGTCTITATEAGRGQTGSTSITQTQVKNKIANAPSTASLLANGAATQVITTTVLNGVSSAPVVGDTVNYTMSGSPAAACGTLSATTGTTNASGQTTTTYTTTTTTGFCTVTATETGTGNSATTVITQHGTSANSVAVAANPTSIAANGTSTSAVTATITGTGTGGDPVAFTTAGGASCGTFSPVTTTANASGVATSTYTSSTTAGTCVVTATEANGGFSNTATITQTAVPNTITLSAAPANLAADGSSTSTVTATVTSGVTSAPVAADFITFSTTGAACGTFTTANPKATDATGKATITYKASTTVGFCTVTGTEQAGAPGTGQAASTTINQQSAAASTVTVTASPTSVPADNATTSTVTAAVRNSSGGPVGNDSVLFATSGAACGTLVGANPINTNGVTGNATITYKASATVGSCSITATEASAGKSGSTSISQTAVLNKVTQTASLNPVPADGATTSTITTTVTHSGTAVAGDAVTYTSSGSPAAACGTLTGSTSPTSATGVVTVTYTASLTVGFCTVTGTEAANGQSASTVITQKGAGANTTAVAANPTSIAANGTSTSTITATVSGAGSAGDPVAFTLSGANCGTLSSAFATTNASGVATTTYTSKAISGPAFVTTSCTISASEANAGSGGSATVTQTDVPNIITLTANPTTIRGDGVATSTLTAHVTNGITGAADTADLVEFFFASGTCGTYPGGAFFVDVATDASGNASTTYTSALAPGTFCGVQAGEFNTFNVSPVVTITQTA